MIQFDDDSLITLTDDDGNEVDFLLLDVVEYNANDYLVLLPMEDEEEDEDNVLILKVEHRGEEEIFNGVEDKEEMNAVFALFTAQLEADAEAAGLPDDDEEVVDAEE
ncbi:MAG: DUF1292 domain-containing protein [Clostridia bacterium]|nr:DUF1292 domain-containing protein [Clostridia bacterium]